MLNNTIISSAHGFYLPTRTVIRLQSSTVDLCWLAKACKISLSIGVNAETHECLGFHAGNESPPPGARKNGPKIGSGNSVVVKASSVILFRLTCCQQKIVLLRKSATILVFRFRSTWKLR